MRTAIIYLLQHFFQTKENRVLVNNFELDTETDESIIDSKCSRPKDEYLSSGKITNQLINCDI